MIQLKSGTFTKTQFINKVNQARRQYSDNSWIAINAIVAGHTVAYRAVGTFVQKMVVDGVKHESVSDSDFNNNDFRKFLQGALK